MHPLVIERATAQTFQQRYGQGLITLLFWALFFYFVRPLISLMGWFFGIEIFTDIMVVQEGYRDLIALLGWYSGIIIAIGAVLEGWAMYNLLHWGRHNKRLQAPPPLTLDATARTFHCDPQQLRIWQQSKRLTLEHDTEGKVTSGQTD